MKKAWMTIHQAIHEGLSEVTVFGHVLQIHIAPNGCRYVTYQDPEEGTVNIMEQNKLKKSLYAQRARNGETLSWVIPTSGKPWTLIDQPVGAYAGDHKC